MDNQQLAKYIDHANHKAVSTKQDIIKLCDEVKQYGFNSAFVNSYWVKFAKERLGENHKVGTVISFPLGQDSTEAKINAISQAMIDGADELDVSSNLGLLKQGSENEYLEELVKLVKVVKQKDPNKIIKFIIEAVLLNNEEIKIASRLVLKSGADFVKTTSGFGPRDAKLEFVKIIRNAVGNEIKVKAAGGIHTREEVEKYLEVGADRIGTSAGVAIITGQQAEENQKSE